MCIRNLKNYSPPLFLCVRLTCLIPPNNIRTHDWKRFPAEDDVVCAVCRAFLVFQQKYYMVFKVRWCWTGGSPHLHCWTCRLLHRQPELAPVMSWSWLNTLFNVTLPGALHVGVSIDTVIIYVRVYYICTLYTFT